MKPTKLLLFWIFLTAALALIAMCQRADAQMKAAIPDFCAGAASTVAAGSTETWTGNRPINGWVCVRGTLVLSGDLSATGVYVDVGGFLDVVSGASLTFNNTSINLAADPRQWGNGLLVFGRVRMLGVEKTPFVRSATELLMGQANITLAAVPIGWAVGDEVFVPDTRHVPISDWFNVNYALRHEIRAIAAISGATLTLSSGLSYDHRGARNADGSLTVLVDGTRLLPHVANLTRSITVRSATPLGTRGHTAYTDRANVEIRHVAFSELGRTTVDATFDQDNSPNQTGRYPVHLHHLQGPVNPTNTGYQFTLTGNVIRDSLKWPLAIHGSHYGLIESNVIIGGAQRTGAGIALENGSETENLIRRNFIADIRGHENPRNTGSAAGDAASSAQAPPSDGRHAGTGGECGWAVAFNNRWIENVVTGCRNTAQNIVAGVGWKFFMPPAPNDTRVRQPLVRGADPTQYVERIAQNQPLLQFDGNEAYGLMADGLTIWQLGTDGYQWNANQAESVIRNFTVWNAYESCVWLYPTNRVTIENLACRFDNNNATYFNTAITGGDYRQVNVTVRGGDLHVRTVFGETIDTVGAWRLENIRATTKEHAFAFQTPATPGTGAGRPAIGVTVSVVNAQITPWPGEPLRTISMNHRTDKQPAWTAEPYVVNVTEGANQFRVCFPIQATENLYGGTCTGSQSRPDIQGLISGSAPPPPPPPPPPPAEVCGDGIDNDLDGQIDEGCPVTPPQEVCGDGVDNDLDGQVDEGCAPPPPPDSSGAVTLPPLQYVGTDRVTVNGVTTWNANTSTTQQVFPFDPSRGTFGQTIAFPNSGSGTMGLWFSVNPTQLATLGQASAIGLASLRPVPDVNIQQYPMRGLEVYRGDPSQPPMLRAIVGQTTPDQAYSPFLTTLAQPTTAIMTWTPTTLALYVNGTLAGSSARKALDYNADVSLMLAAAPHLIHGADQQFLKGTTKDPIVYSRALLAAEVSALHAVMMGSAPPPPPPPPPPVDCVVSAWSEWSAWTTINATTESRTRTRTVVTPASNGGAACPLLSETETRPIVVVPPPPPPPTDPCVVDPLLVTRIAWPTTNTGRRTLTFDVGTKRWTSVSMTWPGTLTVTDTRGCSATVTR